jgi:hypothetical protein
MSSITDKETDRDITSLKRNRAFILGDSCTVCHSADRGLDYRSFFIEICYLSTRTRATEDWDYIDITNLKTCGDSSKGPLGVIALECLMKILHCLLYVFPDVFVCLI